VDRGIEGGSLGGSLGGGGRAAAARALLGQARKFPCCPRVAGTTQGGAPSCACAGMLSTVGGVRGAACALGSHLGSLASDVGRGGTLVEVIGAVPGQDRTRGRW
jgi:hypothetical protein